MPSSETPAMPLSLLVIVPDRVSELVTKGEYAPRYYNPGNLFNEVHIVITNDDRVAPHALQQTVGNATLHVHNLPVGRGWFYRSLGWRPRLLKGWAERAVRLTRAIRPALIRCYGNHLNGYLACRIKQVLGIPYVVSLHGNPDVDGYRGRLGRTWKQKLEGYALEAVEVLGIREANHVIAVYQPIVAYLEEHGITRYSVIYNAVGYGSRTKTSYEIAPGYVKAVCVGRQQSLEKDPTPIIDAVIEMPQVSLLMIGDGDLHDSLVRHVAQAKAGDRIRFERVMPNAQVLQAMADADLFLYASINYEISKASIEAALTGLPVILNDRHGQPAPELVGGHFLLVDGTKESYMRALARVIGDGEYRERLGRMAYAHAHEHWAPAKMEAKVVDVYTRVMDEAKHRA